MLPTAISLFLFIAATTDVASSGSDVPAATTVNPIIVWLIPSELAICTELITTSLPPAIKNARPRNIYSHSLRFGNSFRLTSSGIFSHGYVKPLGLYMIKPEDKPVF